MNDPEKHIARFERYFQKEMEETEERAFESELDSDPAFKKSYRDFEKAMIGIEAAGVKSVLEELQVKSNTQLSRYIKYGIAAMLILGTFVFYFLSVNQPSLNQLSISLFEPYDDILTTRDYNESPELKKAMDAYKQRNYQESLKYLSLIKEENQYYKKTVFYAGIAALGNNEPILAIEYFRQVEIALFEDHVKWYISLAYIRSNQLEKARRALEEIVRNKTYNHQKAQILLSKLKDQ